MKKVLTEIAYYALLPFAGITYVIVDSYRNLKRKKHRNHLHRIGRSSEYNPYCDKY